MAKTATESRKRDLLAFWAAAAPDNLAASREHVVNGRSSSQEEEQGMPSQPRTTAQAQDSRPFQAKHVSSRGSLADDHQLPPVRLGGGILDKLRAAESTRAEAQNKNKPLGFSDADEEEQHTRRKAYVMPRSNEPDRRKEIVGNQQTGLRQHPFTAPARGTREEKPQDVQFYTARQQLALERKRKLPDIDESDEPEPATSSREHVKPAAAPFRAPIRQEARNGGGQVRGGCVDEDGKPLPERLQPLLLPNGELPDKLKHIETRLLEMVMSEVLTQGETITWDSISGLKYAKSTVQQAIIWPLLNPSIFKGPRAPPKGLLLFGPPGTGKTMIGRAIASQANATFFNISASSLTSKWIGDGEKMVRALFALASCMQPAVIFVDEIDSLLSQRKSEGEHESSRRLKTEFLVQMDGCGSGAEERVVLVGATNRPQELDEAARRRLQKRLYIPLPGKDARKDIVQRQLVADIEHTLSPEDLIAIAEATKGFSGADIHQLIREACMYPVLEQDCIENLTSADLRPTSLKDFQDALFAIKPSVAASELTAYEQWNEQFGSVGIVRED
eukprot:jgi/Chlat1/8280/Chrsp78S07734